MRRARPDEAAAVAAFQVLMARETEGLELAPGVVRAGVEAVFADPAKGAYWAADVDGTLAGCLLTTFEWSDWRNASVLWVQSLYVAPEARRRGVWAAFYKTLREAVLADPKLAGIRLYVDQRNERACRAYEAAGMSRDHYDLYEWLK